MTPIRRTLFLVNESKEGASAIGEELAQRAAERQVESTTRTSFPLEEEALEDFDLCVVIGGDGTILGVVEAATHAEIPVMGINLGTLGFMANFSAEEALEAFDDILDGKGESSDRRLLQCHGASGSMHLALNDLVIKAYSSRLVRLTVTTNGELVNNYYADGLILSTPTGSTAYNLSAGGPIVHPAARALVLNPINPHSLTNRAIILDQDAELTIAIQQHFPTVQVAADGVECFSREEDFPLRVRICPRRVFKLLQPTAYSHFHILRTKLRWAGDTPTRLQ
jgi:NAD+ kinase